MERGEVRTKDSNCHDRIAWGPMRASCNDLPYHMGLGSDRGGQSGSSALLSSERSTAIILIAQRSAYHQAFQNWIWMIDADGQAVAAVPSASPVIP